MRHLANQLTCFEPNPMAEASSFPSLGIFCCVFFAFTTYLRCWKH
jgi:hypothetical protein